ncbi:6466_t:CDS:2, partial [Acaulospora morrowiae]
MLMFLGSGDLSHDGIFSKKWSGLRYTNSITKLSQVLSDCSRSYIKIWTLGQPGQLFCLKSFVLDSWTTHLNSVLWGNP